MTGTKNSARQHFSVLFTVALICLMTVVMIPGIADASAVNLGSAGNYAILTKTGITTTGATTINGNIGVSPIVASSMTGFGLSMDSTNQFSRSSLVNGGVYAANYAPPTPATMTTAVSDMEAAYTSAAGQAPSGGTELYAGNLGGKTLAPGVYKWSSGVLIPSATILTLDGKGDGNSVWVFQIAGDLTMASASQIALINGAQTENVFWQVAGPTGVSLGSGSHAEGTILTQKAIIMNSGASLNGRALAQTAVTLIANTITSPTPSSVPAQSTTVVINPTSTQTLKPGQTAIPTETVTLTPTKDFGPRILSYANVGGNTAIDTVEVLGSGNNDLIVTGAEVYNPGTDFNMAPGTVYQYADLSPKRTGSIEQAVIGFNIPRVWLETNKIYPGNVVLYGQNGLTWTALPTTFVKNDGSLDRFTATSPSLNTRFAITGLNFPVEATVTQVTPSDTLVYYTGSQTPATTRESTGGQLAPPTMVQTTKAPLPTWVPVSAVISSLVIMAILSDRKKERS